MFYMNDIARQTKDAMLIDELKTVVLEIAGQAHRAKESLSVADLFKIAKGHDLSRSARVADLYKQISADGWIQSGGASCFMILEKGGGSYSHLGHYSKEVMRETRFRGVAGNERVNRLFCVNLEFLNYLSPHNRALAVFNLRSTSLTYSVNEAMNPRGEPTYIDNLNKIDRCTEKMSVDLFDTLYHRQWVSLLKDTFGEKFTLSASGGMFLVDLYKSRGAEAVMDCLEFRPLFLTSNLVEYSILALTQGSINAKQCIDLITHGARDGLGSRDVQKTMAGKIIRAKGIYGHVSLGILEEDLPEIRRFWLDVLPKAINEDHASQFSPIHGALHVRYKSEKESQITSSKSIEMLELSSEMIRKFLTESVTARMSAVEYFATRNDIIEAADLCLEFCPPASLKENLLSVAKCFTESVTRLRMRSSNFYPFSDTSHCESLARVLNPLFCAQVGHALCEVLKNKSTAPRILSMPGAIPFIRQMAEQDEWSDERRFDFAKSFRSWPIRKFLLEGLQVPSSYFNQLPPGQRGQLISNDFDL